MITPLARLLNAAKNHAGFVRYFKNTSWLFAEQMLRMLSGVLVGIWVARYLGPEQFGIFSYALAFVAIFSTIAKLGLDSIVVRNLVNEPSKRDVYLGTAFWLKIFGAIVSIALISAAILFTNNEDATNLYIFIIASGILFQSFEVVDFYFQSKVLSKFVAICKVTQLLLSSLLKVYLILTEADLIYFVLVSFIDQLLLAVTLYFSYKYQNDSGFYRHFSWSTAKKLIKTSWPLIFSGLVIVIYMRIDQIMIQNILGYKEVGIYTAAVKLSEAFYFIPVIVASSLFPAIINAKGISDSLYNFRLQRLFTLMVWFAILIALPVSLNSQYLMTLLYGNEYREAASVLVISIWASVFVFLGVSSGNWFVIENLERYALYRTFCGMVVNVLLNLILIPKYGIVGAALATLIAQIVAALLFDLFNKNTRKLFYLKLSAFNIMLLKKKVSL